MSESAEQKEIVRWFREEYPQYRRSLRVSLAGLNFGSGKRAAVMVNHVRSQGIEEGEADIAIMLPRGGYHALIMEHKAADGYYKASDAQNDYIDYHTSIGNCAVITKGIEAAKAAIKTYLEAGYESITD